jgi:hypothetical protein
LGNDYSKDSCSPNESEGASGFDWCAEESSRIHADSGVVALAVTATVCDQSSKYLLLSKLSLRAAMMVRMNESLVGIFETC